LKEVFKTSESGIVFGEIERDGHSYAYIYYPAFEDEFTEEDYKYITPILDRTEGLIFDIRNNTGGNGELGISMAGQFFRQTTLIGYTAIKSGKGHNDFSDAKSLHTTPNEKHNYLGKKTMLLTNRKVYSTANLFTSALKLAENVTQIGGITGGGGGMPMTHYLPNGWIVVFPANVLLDTNKEQAAFEVEQYMSTYKENGWKIAGEVYILQSKLNGIAPSNQARNFYRGNVEKAENFVYSDIPIYELTYKGIVTNKAGKEKASLENKQKKIFIRTSLTSQLRKASVGDLFLVRVFQQDKKQIALTIHPSGKRVEVTPKSQNGKQVENGDIETISGIVSLPAQGNYSFIDHQYYVPAKITIANNLKEGDRVDAKAKKMPDGRWRVVSINKCKV
jgi:hypothetical protein